MVLQAEVEEQRINKDFLWLAKNTQALQDKYQGEWVAVVDEKVVGVGKDAKEAYSKAKKIYPNKEPLLEVIPKKELLVL